MNSKRVEKNDEENGVDKREAKERSLNHDAKDGLSYKED